MSNNEDMRRVPQTEGGSRPVRVRFVPQAWINDYAVEIDPSGPVEWDTRALPEAVQGTHDDVDTFQYERWFLSDPDCPAWVKDHSGPFLVEMVGTTVAEYFRSGADSQG